MSLAPVRDALLADARREGDARREDAERAATAAIGDARHEADRLVREARAAGDREAQAAAATDLARARRHARELVLAARREAYEAARAQARRAATELAAAPGYDELVAHLARLARDQLGDRAEVTLDADQGGLVARAGSRSVDYRLPEIADRCLADLGSEVEALWR